MESAIAGAETSGGLADPTLLGAIERAGYSSSRAGRGRAPLAIRRPRPSDPAARTSPARGRPDPEWSRIEVDRRRDTIARPPGVRIDLGAFALIWGLAFGQYAGDRQAAASAPLAGGESGEGGLPSLAGTDPAMPAVPSAPATPQPAPLVTSQS